MVVCRTTSGILAHEVSSTLEVGEATSDLIMHKLGGNLAAFDVGRTKSLALDG